MSLMLFSVLFFILITVLYLVGRLSDLEPLSITEKPILTQKPIQQSQFKYHRRSSIATQAEQMFYHRLVEVSQNKYLVLPQIHLSSLAINKTTGKYHKLGFQRINRRSVDFVIADKRTLAPVYAVELDDRTHDTEKARAIDRLKTEVLEQVGIPLVRFRNVSNLSDEDIIEAFRRVKPN